MGQAGHPQSDRCHLVTGSVTKSDHQVGKRVDQSRAVVAARRHLPIHDLVGSHLDHHRTDLGASDVDPNDCPPHGPSA